MAISCNTAFAWLGNELGADALRTQAQLMGFDEQFQIPLRAATSRFPENPDDPQTAMSAIGQFDVRATALQMAMVAAALGFLPPVWGAVLQEAIDVAVILNALRALAPGRRRERHLDPQGTRLAQQFSAEHTVLRPRLDEVRAAADGLGAVPAGGALDAVRRVHQFLTEDLLPHELAEDQALYPAVARVLGGTDPTGAMSRSHVEIGHQIRRLGRLLEELPADGPDEEDVAELRRLLYGLHAILRLHFAQEEEGYLSLIPPGDYPKGG